MFLIFIIITHISDTAVPNLIQECLLSSSPLLSSPLLFSQCMVMRVMTYLDKDRTIVKEINEWFENRKDKMYKRVRTFLEIGRAHV